MGEHFNRIGSTKLSELHSQY